MKIFESVEQLKLSQLKEGQFVETKGYYSPADNGRSKYLIQTPADYGDTPDEFVDFTLVNGNIAVNIEKDLRSSMAGVKSDGLDYTDNMRAIVGKLDESKTLYVDSSSFALSDTLLINNGFKKINHQSDCELIWIGKGLTSTTTEAIYSINIDETGFRTNETLIGLTTVEAVEGDSTFTVDSTTGLSKGDVLRVDKHICRVINIDGLVVETDRTLPIPSQAIGSEVSRLDKPNINSTLEGCTIRFANDNLTQNYGMGVLCGLCYGVTIKGFRGIHNASILSQIFYCADSYLEDMYQYEPTDVPGGGQSYAARISNGNDNIARNIKSYKGRHCVDITFSHRNRVFDCQDYFGVEASYLTHFNGSRFNKFIRCDMYYCLFGVYLSADNGDFDNSIEDSFFYNSRCFYRFPETSYARRCRVVSTLTSVDIIVPRGNPGIPVPSVFNFEDCHFDLAGKFSNVDTDYTVNFVGGSYRNSRIDGLFRAISSGVPGDPSTVGEAKFFFSKGCKVHFSIGQGRNNKNAKVYFDGCQITYEEQPFGEDMGDQSYTNCVIENVNASDRYLLTVGSQNNCTLSNNVLKNIKLPFRYFATFPADGSVSFGNNALLDGSNYNTVNGLANMSWTATGDVHMTLPASNNGSPTDGSIVYIDSDVTTDPFKRKRVLGAWVDWIV